MYLPYTNQNKMHSWKIWNKQKGTWNCIALWRDEKAKGTWNCMMYILVSVNERSSHCQSKKHEKKAFFDTGINSNGLLTKVNRSCVEIKYTMRASSFNQKELQSKVKQWRNKYPSYCTWDETFFISPSFFSILNFSCNSIQ